LRKGGEGCTMRCFVTCILFTKCDQMKEGQMGGAYSTHDRDEKLIKIVGEPEGKREL